MYSTNNLELLRNMVLGNARCPHCLVKRIELLVFNKEV